MEWGPWQYHGTPDLGDIVQVEDRCALCGDSETHIGTVVFAGEHEMPLAPTPMTKLCVPKTYRWCRGKPPEFEAEVRKKQEEPA